MKSAGANIYPKLSINKTSKPRIFYALPIIGILSKVFMLIPVYFWLFLLGIAVFVELFINSFVVLFTGKYWKPAYKLTLGVMRYLAKANFFFYGMTDEYPGFSLSNPDSFQIDMECPQSPNRVFALPVVGLLGRVIGIIPFYIYYYVISYAVVLGIFTFGWVFVLFKRQYLEGLYELVRDSQRLMLSMAAYGSGLSDKYPSFSISWNHKKLKIVLIVAAVLYLVWSNYNDLNKQNPKLDDSSQPQVQINTL